MNSSVNLLTAKIVPFSKTKFNCPEDKVLLDGQELYHHDIVVRKACLQKANVILSRPVSYLG